MVRQIQDCVQCVVQKMPRVQLVFVPRVNFGHLLMVIIALAERVQERIYGQLTPQKLNAINAHKDTTFQKQTAGMLLVLSVQLDKSNPQMDIRVWMRQRVKKTPN